MCIQCEELRGARTRMRQPERCIPAHDRGRVSETTQRGLVAKKLAVQDMQSYVRLRGAKACSCVSTGHSSTPMMRAHCTTVT
jgi:hypothetical protein